MAKDNGTILGEGFGFEIFLKNDPANDAKIAGLLGSIIEIPRPVLLKQFVIFLKANAKDKKGIEIRSQNYQLLKTKIFDKLVDHLASEKDFKFAAKMFYQFQFFIHEGHGHICDCMLKMPILREYSFWKAWFGVLVAEQNQSPTSDDVLSFGEAWLANFGSIQRFVVSREKLNELYNGVAIKVTLPPQDQLLAMALERKESTRLVLWRPDDLEPSTEPNSFDNSKVAKPAQP